MSIGPPQASSMRTSRSDGNSRRSPAAARPRIGGRIGERRADPTGEPGPAAAATDGDPPVRVVRR